MLRKMSRIPASVDVSEVYPTYDSSSQLTHEWNFNLGQKKELDEFGLLEQQGIFLTSDNSLAGEINAGIDKVREDDEARRLRRMNAKPVSQRTVADIVDARPDMLKSRAYCSGKSRDYV